MFKLNSTASARSARSRYKPDGFIYLTAAFSWISVWRFQDLWPIIGKIQLPIALEVLLAISLALNLGGARQLKWVRSRIFAIPFLLLLLMTASLSVSLWPGKSFIFLTKDFAPTLLLMVCVTLASRESEDLEWLGFAHLVGATIYSLWIFMFVAVGSDGRLGGVVYYDANDFALLIVCTIPFALYFLRARSPLFKRVFATAALMLFLEMIIKSGSRGGFIALVAVTVYIVVAFRAIPAKIRLSAVGLAALILTVFGSTAYWNMMRTILHPAEDYNMTEQTGRKFVWKRGVDYMLQRPILGVGADAFNQAEGSLSAISRQYAAENRGLKWSTAHNSYVLVGAELGAGGLLLFVTMLMTSFSHLLQIKSGPEEDPVISLDDVAFAQMLTASLLGFCVAGFFVSGAYFSFLYALIGFIIAADSLRRRRHACAPTTSQAAVAAVSKTPGRSKSMRTHWLPTG